MQKLFLHVWIAIFSPKKAPPSPLTLKTVSSATTKNQASIKYQQKPVPMDDLLRALGADL